MVWLKKLHAGAAPGYTWEHDGDVLDVDEELANELLERPGGEFVSVAEPEAPAAEPEGKPDGGEPAADADEDDAGTKKRPRRTKVAE